MKHLFACITLTLAATLAGCANTKTVKVEGALGRQLERVLSRHDVFVEEDLSLAVDLAQSYLAESDGVRALVVLPNVERAALGAALAPVSARHDAYVRADESLEDVARDTYLAATAQLKRVLEPPQ